MLCKIQTSVRGNCRGCKGALCYRCYPSGIPKLRSILFDFAFYVGFCLSLPHNVKTSFHKKQRTNLFLEYRYVGRNTQVHIS